MKSKALIIPAVCFAWFAFNTANPDKEGKKINVSGTVTKTHSYCGGARPNDEILAQLGVPKPIGNKKIYIKKGEINSFGSKTILTLTTDSIGNFHARLRPGKYLIVDSTRNDLTHYNTLLKTYKEQTKDHEPIDTVCLKEWYLKPDCVFEVAGAELKNISVNYLKPCPEYIPCCMYRGRLRE